MPPSAQAPSAVVMVRPHHFHPNPETAGDNAFQARASDLAAEDTARRAFAEVTAAAAALEAAGVRVHLFDDQGERHTPDAVFPNNWFSTHAGGHVAVYPMYAENRRRERRSDVIERLKAEYRVQDVIDYSGLEADGLFLEGTGAMVLDHIHRIAYTAQSNRADPVALERFCTHFNYEPMAFATADAEGKPCYHTNVMLCVGTDFALGGFHLVTDPARRNAVRARLRETGRELIELSPWQIGEFAGNALELQGTRGRVLALSARAAASLSPTQKAVIERSAALLPLAVPTIELAGGSVRCMLAGIHLARREILQAKNADTA
ncbi:citrulline utilization hydrolase CtlX [Acidovorax sp. FJL06]|uniref:citrulline utilization hydrolase CtlX n=1 Tax=Acidovorax sp. FJL06 TaxID=2153365 RepID=UPI000F564587|nr:arginine deiminase-related protein [Acidovorax sp. FJL06]RQO80681.1 amidinotransferase [Acidovorax sp. FJL06]